MCRAESRQFERDLTVAQQLLQVVQPQIDDVAQLLFAQRTEDHDVIHAVEKLRPEALAENLHYLLTRTLEGFLSIERFALQHL